MLFSPLASVLSISPNYSSRCGVSVSKITPHHTAGKIGVENLLHIFENPERRASANYCIGFDGTIGGCVPEEFAAWTTSSQWNDRQAITIEVSDNMNGEPWKISDAAWNSLIMLSIDICLRYGFKLTYADENISKSVTLHKWFAATSCPGTWMCENIERYVKEVNKGIETIEELKKGIEEFKKYEQRQNEMLNRLFKAVEQLSDRLSPKYNSVDECPDWSRSSVKWAIDNEIISGENGKLMLSYDDVREICYLKRTYDLIRKETLPK